MGQKRIVLFILSFFLISASIVWGQDAASASGSAPADNSQCPKAYLGLNLGLNNPNGILGFSFEIPIIKNVALSAGAGAGLWGSTIFAEGRYYITPCHRGWALGGGISHSSGQHNFQPHKMLATVSGAEHVSLDLLQQTNLYLSIYRSWNLGKKKNKFYATAGWSAPLRTARFRQISGDKLVQSSMDKVQGWAPGGLMLGVGIYFGIH